MPAAPDYHLPAIFDLSTSSVQGISTGEVAPRMTMDPTGLRTYTSSGGSGPGGRLASFISTKTASGGPLMIPGDFLSRTGLGWTQEAAAVGGVHTDAELGTTAASIDAAVGDRSKNSALSRLILTANKLDYLNDPRSPESAQVELKTSHRTTLRLADRLRHTNPDFDDLFSGEPPGILEARFSSLAGGDESWTRIIDAFGASDFVQGGNLIYAGRKQGAEPYVDGFSVTLPRRALRGIIVILVGSAYVGATPAVTALGVLLNGGDIGFHPFEFNALANIYRPMISFGNYTSPLGSGTYTIKAWNVYGNLIANAACWINCLVFAR